MVSAAASEGGRLLKLGLVRDAVHEFEKGLAKNGKDEACLLGLARAHLSQGEGDAGRGSLVKLLALSPAHSEAQSHLAMLDAQRGDSAALVKLEELSLAPKAGFFEHYNLANTLQARGDTAGAEAAFGRAAKAQPDNPFVLVELGLLSMSRQDAKASVKHFSRAAELMPNEWVPAQLYARALALDGQLGQAVAVLNGAVAKSAEQPSLYEDLFKFCMAAGSATGAAKAAMELRRLKPEDPNPLYLHGLATLTLGDVAGAKKLFEAALSKAPGSWELKQALAKAHVLLKEEKPALKLLEEANAAAPEASGPANDLALLLMSRPQGAARAQKVLERVFQHDPEDLGTRLNLALSLVQQGKKREAVPHVEKAKASPDKDVREQAERLQKQLR
ncbi:MAG: tetratricopeptide repeat protein [Myxococcaceae bacterium]